VRDYHILPKLRDSLSYIYIEHAVIQRYRQSVEVVDQEGRAALPIAALSLLMLGPGTRITHEAVKLLADNGCSILWVGEDGTKFYAQGLGETRKAHRLLHQARLVSDLDMHHEVAMAMYKFRFDEDLEPGLTIEQLRGHEGVRVRNFYQIMSRRYGVQWRGRRYDRNQWDHSDPINRALSAANALMNGICHAAIVSGGYSPGLGFIHTGKLLSFVYDIADLYKTEISIPAAFEVVALGEEAIEPRVRQRMRRALKEAKLLQRILPDIDALLNLGDAPTADESDYDADGALPSPLWDEFLNALELREDE
jgi:CRISP-associated protein Cas1